MQNTTQDPPGQRKLTPMENVLSLLPIALITVGGLVGGAIGGAAIPICQAILTSERPAWLKGFLLVLTYGGAIAAYILAVSVIATAFPGLFRR